LKEFIKYDRDVLRELIEFHKWLFVAEKDLTFDLAGKLDSEMPSDFS
jgi:hypothetical protein